MRADFEFRFSNFGFRISNLDFRFSNILSRHGTLLALLLAVSIWLALPVPMAAQGCAMCYTSAAAAKKAGLQALREGILILGIPPLVMFIGIFLYVFRRREHFSDTNFDDDRGRDDVPTKPILPSPCGYEDEPEAVLAAAIWPGERERYDDSISSQQGH